ncbi:proteoglycan 4 isoform X1 [Drosophila biarmipes]|uniref:proteoglycan 4 isoform X1 n=1 Tax=Drosophila biarmipes TaxID=125945 RepID=UPI0021CCD6AC|nr:proteoglycan 4 isoform X1 [Drosophila biarmipes]XP_050744777.1 proteoglycan 4 isoform X1 [Drosophila biarmipes]
MHWLDGISLDDNLISGRASGSNGDNSDGNQRKSTQSSSSPTKAKRRRHAHYKLNSRLDRKSSRGMIYENEELRLRTININAEVERGQSDIKRLRRENEQLRREIWTLRDECDRLNKRFKAKLSEHEFGGCRGSGGSGGTCHAYRCSGGGGGRGSGGCDVNSDDSDSCDTCRGADDGHCSDECCQEGGSCAPLKPPLPPEVPSHPSPSKNEEGGSGAQNKEQQPMHFDHLSVVSEETLSNPELMLAQQQEHLTICPPDPHGSQSTLPSGMGPLTPLTPIEKVANQLNDLQAMVPPLSYFENILAQHMGARNAAQTPSPELGTSSSTTTGKTMRHTNGWDYNLQSPFTQRKYSDLSSPSRSPPPPVSTMTTFVPTSTLQTMPRIALNAPPHLPAGGDIETVAITTNAAKHALNSPKHFFAPIKPRLKLNTKLANQGQDLEQDDLPPGSPPPPLRDPPDIFVNNALASPYQRRVSPQVSPRHRRSTHSHCHAHSHQRSRQRPQPTHCSLHRAVVDVAAAVGLGEVGLHPGSSVLDIYTAALAAAAAARCSPFPTARSAEPIYATAQKPGQNTCISATAFTQPVMTITTHSTKTTTSPLRLAGKAKAVGEAKKVAKSAENVSQTDSVNLESILNDIETISEDILAIQLEKSKSRDNLSHSNNKDDDRAKKPYRSEMNLYLQYDGTNPTISPATTETEMGTATPAVTSSSESGNSGSSKLVRRTRSLEREHTDSPAPHIPDPMAPFPDKCTYLGFEQVNQAAGGAGVPLQSPNGPRPPIAAKPNVPLKPPPPLPPARRPTMPSEPPPPPPTTSASGVIGLPPNKSHLYKSLASAAAKRAIFRSSPSQATRSLDVDLTGTEAEAGADQAAAANMDELARRKARRVSIVCGSGQGAQPDEVAAPVTTVPMATASCVDLSTVLTHPSIKAFKMSHSTPSSPHSSRRRTNSNSMAPPPGATGGGHPEVGATASAPPSTTHPHHHRKEGSDPVPMTATVSRTKCSRRHSEGTVHTVHRNSSASGGGGHHHHSHGHHHPHSGMVISSNPHHSHHSHQDSNHETVTSLSDRNSNSFASSRESSTSFSMRSTRRKISVSSHTGGKIPWCGCWGNGCL